MRRLVELGLAVSLISVSIACAKSVDRNDQFGGAPAYQDNQPFLDWRQTGDLLCTEEFGPCGGPSKKPDGTPESGAVPLRIAHVEIPVGKPGRHQFELGNLVFPQSVHTRTFFKIANADEQLFRVVQPHVEFRSLAEGAPAFTQFARDRPLVDGLEPVQAFLVWDVESAEPDAVMNIEDLEIH